MGFRKETEDADADGTRVTPAALLLEGLDAQAGVTASGLINDTVYRTNIGVSELRNKISSR